MRSELVVQQLHRDVTLAQGRERQGEMQQGGHQVQTAWGWAKFKPTILPCMIHDRAAHSKATALTVSAWHAHWWASTSPSARLMASPGIQAYCSHTRKGPMGCPSSSTSLHQIQPCLCMCGMPFKHDTGGHAQQQYIASVSSETSLRWTMLQLSVQFIRGTLLHNPQS